VKCQFLCGLGLAAACGERPDVPVIAEGPDVRVIPVVSDEFAEYADASGEVLVFNRGRQPLADPWGWTGYDQHQFGSVQPGEAVEVTLPGGPLDLFAEGSLDPSPTCGAGCDAGSWEGDASVVIIGHGWEVFDDPDVEPPAGQQVHAGSATEIPIPLRFGCDCND
jgi:hypothetical protein